MLGFLFVALIAIPLTVYLVQQQLETRTQAVKNTTLSFDPTSVAAEVGEDLSFDINLSPGSNQVAIVKLVIKFDSTKLEATEESFELNPTSQLSVLQGPTVATDTLSVVLSVGSDPTKVIQTDTTIGTVTFNVIGGASTSTDITFDPTTEANSINAGDGFSENVFLSGNPATIDIQGEGGNVTPSPTISQEGGNSAPVCTALGTDVQSSGTAPYTVTFTANGSDADGRIENSVFTFEPNFTEDVATSSSGPNESVTVTATHTYDTPGIFTANVVFKDDADAESSSASCSQTITITDEDGNTNTTDDGTGEEIGTTTDETTTESSTEETSTEVVPSPIPPTGPEDAIVGFGVLGGLLFLIGTLLFLAL